MAEKFTLVYLINSDTFSSKGQKNCVYQGHFEGHNSQIVAVTSSDCPRNSNSTMQMSFYIPEICSDVMFFDILSDGTGQIHKFAPLKIDHPTLLDVAIKRSHIRNNTFARQAFLLTDEFTLKLRIMYDDAFNMQFGANSEDRYR